MLGRNVPTGSTSAVGPDVVLLQRPPRATAAVAQDRPMPGQSVVGSGSLTPE